MRENPTLGLAYIFPKKYDDPHFVKNSIAL
jgi:hypothetical protein